MPSGCPPDEHQSNCTPAISGKAEDYKKIARAWSALFINSPNFLIVQLTATLGPKQLLATVIVIIWPFLALHCIDDTTREGPRRDLLTRHGR